MSSSHLDVFFTINGDRSALGYPKLREERLSRAKGCAKCYFIPPYLEARVSEASHEIFREWEDLSMDSPSAKFRASRMERQTHCHLIQKKSRESTADQSKLKKKADELQFIYDARHGTSLPGHQVNKKDFNKDKTVLRAFDASVVTYLFYKTTFNRDSIDGRGMDVQSTVHYGSKYCNAFWQGEQMVYGDGDGKIFDDFTKDPDVVGHELSHGVMQYSAAHLDYFEQAGALNEHFSDAMGAMIKQWSKNETVEEADWLIGDRVLIGGGALRSMKAPGTAYKDHPVLGSDPQPASMDAYRKMQEDSGGVHINSGIPNHAFYIAAQELKGHSWEKAGEIWYDVITAPTLRSNASFQEFADATLRSAEKLFGKQSDPWKAVMKGWREVKVFQ